VQDREEKGEELNSTEGWMEAELHRRWRLNQQVGSTLALLAGVFSTGYFCSGWVGIDG
jgi:hypothetical protein